MSVTINDIMKLPSMASAEVIAGKKGLQRIISSVSVLESVNPELIESHAYHTDELSGSEIVITGFLNAADDPSAQFELVRNMCDSGEAGVIIYYVGVFVKEIPDRIISYADENDFVIIRMPVNQPNLRYSDAICDIMEAVIRDRDSRSTVVSLIDSIARLRPERQNTGTMIRLISERLRATVMLTDSEWNARYESAWPAELTGSHIYLSDSTVPDDGEAAPFPQIPGGYIRRKTVRTDFSTMELLFLTIGEPVKEEETVQAAEAVRIALSIWSRRQENAAVSELVKAILDDDPLKMKSLASLFGIDTASINSMWIFHGNGFRTAQAKALAEAASIYARTAFADLYGDDLILFTGNFASESDMQGLREHAEAILGTGFISSFFTNLRDTGEVRKAFLLDGSCITDVSVILPGRRYYTGQELGFARDTRLEMNRGEERIGEILSVFDPFDGMRDRDEMIRTLSAYLLDTDRGITDTAERLFVHRNTVKYRINAMSDRLGFSVGDMPASWMLYRAAAVVRLLG